MTETKTRTRKRQGQEEDKYEDNGKRGESVCASDKGLTLF